MLDLLFGLDLDGGTPWRHMLADDEARAGWTACGPAGLLSRLGVLFGTPLQPEPLPLRVAAYALRLAQHDDGARTYSRSRAIDAWGVARYLLALRDSLRSAGWDGRPLTASARLRELSELEGLAGQDLPPGEADLLLTLLARLAGGRTLPPGLTVRLVEPQDLHPPLFRDLLDALAGQGATVVDAADDAVGAPASTDLGCLQRLLLTRGDGAETAKLAGDGSVLILEAETPGECADLLAVWLGACQEPRRTLVVASRETLLDQAIARQGLSRLGLASASRWRAALQVLPLRLALAFRPKDPLYAVELLTLPVAPLPGRVRRKLLRALGEAPGIGGPVWLQAVETCAAEAEAEARASAAGAGLESAAGERAAAEAGLDVRRKVDSWFGGDAVDPEIGILPGEAASLCRQVAAWATARAAGSTESPDGLLLHAAAVAVSLEQMLIVQPPEVPLTRLQLDQLHDTAVGSGATSQQEEGEAGRPALCRGPGAVLGGAAEVVWWGFVGPAGAGGSDPWTQAERAALHAAGLRLPEAGEQRWREAWTWRRAVLSASERVIFVRWRLDGRERAESHPFEDELAARLADGSMARCTWTAEEVAAGRPLPVREGVAGEPAWIEHQAAPALAPRALWRLAGTPLAPPAQLSATSILALFSCPLRWTLHYVAKLRPGARPPFPDVSRLVGSFAHALLADLLTGPGAVPVAAVMPEEARRRAEQAFDQRVATEAAPLLRPSMVAELQRARETVGRAAAVLVELLRRGSWQPSQAEVSIGTLFAGLPVTGRIDLVVQRESGEPGILDLKLGNAKYRRSELQDGTALQLALYARALAAGADELPPTAYFALEDGRLFSDAAGAFLGAEEVRGPGPETTLRLAERGWAWWRQVLDSGLVPATGATDEDWQFACKAAAGVAPEGVGPAAKEPPCRYCDHTTLCHVRIG